MRHGTIPSGEIATVRIIPTAGFEGMMVSEVYLIRHATAEPTRIGQNDSDRNLTATGIAEATRVADCLQALGIVIDVIRCSPLARAQQTAQIIAHHYALPMTIDQRLAPGFDYSIVQNYAHSRQHRSIAFVAHQPDLAWIVWSATGVQHEFACAGIVRLEPAMPRWRLAFALAPYTQERIVAGQNDPWTHVTRLGEPLDG